MRIATRNRWFFSALATILFVAIGCKPSGQGHTGVYILFEGRPAINKEGIFINNHLVGKITATEFKGSTITRLTVAIGSDFKKQISSNWVFYADNGRILAEPLQSSGKKLQAGDKLCGFSSIGALNWFKFKTLLNDRSYKASKRAESLAKRFELL